MTNVSSPDSSAGLLPRPPATPLPRGACDCHFHVFGPAERYPYSAARTYTPREATLDQYIAMCDQIGLDRAVIVQASVYGFDNSALVDALTAHPTRLRGIAVVEKTVGESDLARLSSCGVRGVRINPRFDAGMGLAELQEIAARITDFGWHIQLIADAAILGELPSIVKRLPVPLVLDHMGHARDARDPQSPVFRDLLTLAESGKVWTKLSGAYFLSRDRPHYRDTILLQQALASAAPERMLWGSNWPHPGMRSPLPTEGDLLDLLAEAVPDVAQRNAILMTNPAELYGFSPAANGDDT